MMLQQQQHSNVCLAASALAQLLTDNARLQAQQSGTDRMNPSSTLLKTMRNRRSKSSRHQQRAMVLLSSLHRQHPRQQQAGSARQLSAVQQQAQQLRHSSRPTEPALLGLAATTLNWQ
jgi:hypothetical protein